MNPLSLIAPKTVSDRRAQRKAAEFQAGIKPGHTYYSVVDCYWPWGKGRLLHEWTFSKPGRWIGQEPRHGHMTAAYVWLNYGPIHERRPAELQTFDEFRRRPSFPTRTDVWLRNPDDVLNVIREAKPTPAGV